MKLYVLGKGNVLTAGGLYEGLPCIAFADVDEGKEIGTAATEEEAEYLKQHGTVIVMPNLKAAERVLEIIVDSVRQYEESLKSSDEAE